MLEVVRAAGDVDAELPECWGLEPVGLGELCCCA